MMAAAKRDKDWHLAKPSEAEEEGPRGGSFGEGAFAEAALAFSDAGKQAFDRARRNAQRGKFIGDVKIVCASGLPKVLMFIPGPSPTLVTFSFSFFKPTVICFAILVG